MPRRGRNYSIRRQKGKRRIWNSSLQIKSSFLFFPSFDSNSTIVRRQSSVLKIDHSFENTIQRHLGPKPYEVPNFRNIRNPPRHVFEALFVSFIVGDEGYLRF